MPTHLWSYAIKHVVYLINRVPSPVIQNKTPYELLNKHPLEFSMLKIFGCLSYACTYKRTQISPCSRRGVFLGFQTGTKGYIILDLNT